MRVPKIFVTNVMLTTVGLLAVFLLLVAQGARAAVPGLVQAKATKISSGTTNNTIFSQPNGAGDLIVVHVLWGNTGGVALTDTKTNTYTPVAPPTRFSNNQYSSQIFYAKDIAGAPAGANTVKATFNTSINNWAMVYVHEYSGMDKISPVDVFGATSGSGTTMSGSLTTHQNNSLIFAAAVASNGTVTGADPSYTVHSTLSGDWTMSKVQPTAGAVSATASRSNGPWVLQMVAFKPDGTPPPNQPPVVSLTQPGSGTVVKGNVAVSATASDPDGAVAKVEFYAGTQLLFTDFQAPYEFQWDTTTMQNAQHSLTAKAYDATTSTISTAAQVTVDNLAPSVPANLRPNNITSSEVAIAWDAASDNLAIGGYNVYKDGVQVATVTGTTYLATGLSPETTYNFAVSARDTVGNESALTPALPVTTMPDMPPQVAITTPMPGATVRGNLTVAATATDDVTVERVEFRLDGQLVATDATGDGDSYGFSLDTTQLTNAPHEITATAFDNLSQYTEAIVTVIVDNVAPDAPTQLTAVAESSSQVVLNWTASVGDAAYYKVWRGASEVASNVTGTSFIDTGLSPETTYSYSVKAYDAVGNESAAATASATTLPAPDTTPPTLQNGQPTGQLASGTQMAVLSLDTNEVATCRYATVAGTPYDAMSSVFSSTGNTNHTTQLSGLADGQSYIYYVRCQDQGNNANLADYIVTFSVANSAPTGIFPLRTSANGKYLEDQTGAPFLIMGDSPQGIIPSLTLSEVDSYLINRKNYGFNTLWINLLAQDQTGGPANGATVEGNLPFNGYLPGHSGDPEYYDLSQPNSAYFNKAKEVIRKASDQGMLVILDPMETMDHLVILRHNNQVDPNSARQYGQYLGTTFQEFKNIVWMHGNDFQTWGDLGDRTLVRTVGEGIRELDNPDAMQTVLGYASPSVALDFVEGKPGTGENSGPADPAWAPFMNIDTVYTYGPSYDYVAPEYIRSGNVSSGRIPVYLAETYYDFEDAVGRPNRPIKEFRWQQYWAMLSGAAGHTYGNYDSVYLDGNWTPKLDTPAAANFSRWNQFFKSYAWYDLLPDQSLITAGADGGDWNRATASITENGGLGMVYIPNARNITINMARFNGQVTAKWFNPVTATYQTIGTFANSGTRQFTPPAGNHTETNWYGGTETSNDWVLVLETAPAVPDTQAPTVPTNLQAAAQSSSQINLSWTASTDNIAVTGYNVYRNSVLINGNVIGTTYQDTGLAAETAYSYTVSAHDAAGNNSAQSASVNASTLPAPPPDTTAPTVPSGLSAAVVSSSQINLGWAASTDNPGGSGLKQYRVYCSTDNVQFIELTPFPTGAGFNSTGLNPNTLYYYKVKAEDNAGNLSDFSANVSATTSAGSPISLFLKAAWGFNEGSGTSTGDISGNNNTATINGTNPWASGKYGNGLNLNGSGNYLSTLNSSSLDVAGNELTLSLWINPQQSSSSDSIILGKFWNASTWTDPYYQYGLELWSGQPVLQIGTSTGLKYVSMGTNVANDGQWKHLAVVYNGTNAKFYLNGTLVSTQSLTGAIVARGNAMNIGADQSANQFFKGGIDDVRIYNKALTQQDIVADMNTPL